MTHADRARRWRGQAKDMSLRDREPTLVTLPEIGLERRSQEGDLSLVVISENATAAHPLRRGTPVIVGNGVNIGIESPSVSRRHAHLFVGERIRIEDLGSRNGTFIRGAPLPPGELAELGTSDLVELKSSVSMGGQASARHGQTAENALLDLARLFPRIAQSSVGVILGGETGVGKEVIARRLLAILSFARSSGRESSRRSHCAQAIRAERRECFGSLEARLLLEWTSMNCPARERSIGDLG
jgi:hypothetical protein